MSAPTGVSGSGQGLFHSHVIGDVTNTTNYYYAQETEVRARRVTPNIVDPDALAAEEVRFAPPPGLTGLVTELRDRRRFIILAGGPESGLRTAGRYLLRQLSRERPLVIRMETPDKERGLSNLLADKDDHHGLVLDLTSDADDGVAEQVAGQLGHFNGLLERHHSYLVVAVPIKAAPRFENGFPTRYHELKRPEGSAVFNKRLTAAQFPPDVITQWASHGEIPARLAEAWPAEVSRITDLIAEVDPERVGPRERGVVFDGAYRDWSAELDEFFKNRAESDRANLAALAFLEGAAPETVFTQGRLLLEGLGYQHLEPHRPFSGTGITDRLAQLGAANRTTGVEFGKPQFAHATRHYVWREYPEHREDFEKWLTDIPLTKKAVTGADLERVVDDVVELLAAHGESQRLTRIAANWLQNASKRNNLNSMLFRRATVSAAVDDRIGADVRRRLYLWARDPATDVALAVEVAHVCGELAEAFLDVAMTRLRHLARRHDESIADAVVGAVRRAASVRGGYDKVLDEVVAWIDDPDDERRNTGLRCFRALIADPRRVTLGKSVLDGWCALLRHSTVEAVEPAVTSWLHGAATHPEQCTAMLDLLVRAAAGSVDTFVMVNLIRYYWTAGIGAAAALDDEIRRDVGIQLTTKLDENDPILARLATQETL